MVVAPRSLITGAQVVGEKAWQSWIGPVQLYYEYAGAIKQLYNAMSNDCRIWHAAWEDNKGYPSVQVYINTIH